jgi:hypothetical protein
MHEVSERTDWLENSQVGWLSIPMGLLYLALAEAHLAIAQETVRFVMVQ